MFESVWSEQLVDFLPQAHRRTRAGVPSPMRTREDWFLAFPSWICTV